MAAARKCGKPKLGINNLKTSTTPFPLPTMAPPRKRRKSDEAWNEKRRAERRAKGGRKFAAGYPEWYRYTSDEMRHAHDLCILARNCALKGKVPASARVANMNFAAMMTQAMAAGVVLPVLLVPPIAAASAMASIPNVNLAVMAPTAAGALPVVSPTMATATPAPPAAAAAAAAPAAARTAVASPAPALNGSTDKSDNANGDADAMECESDSGPMPAQDDDSELVPAQDDDSVHVDAVGISPTGDDPDQSSAPMPTVHVPIPTPTPTIPIPPTQMGGRRLRPRPGRAGQSDEAAEGERDCELDFEHCCGCCLVCKRMFDSESLKGCLERKDSELDGVGLFATQNLRKGDPVVEYEGKIQTHDRKSRPSGKYIVKVSGSTYIHGSESSMGSAANHGCAEKANCELRKKVLPGRTRETVFIVAREDIEKGSEILFDYGDGHDLGHGCRCGSLKCRSLAADGISDGGGSDGDADGFSNDDEYEDGGLDDLTEKELGRPRRGGPLGRRSSRLSDPSDPSDRPTPEDATTYQQPPKRKKKSKPGKAKAPRAVHQKQPSRRETTKAGVDTHGRDGIVDEKEVQEEVEKVLAAFGKRTQSAAGT